MAIQFGTVDGLVNITESTIQCFVKAIHEFSLQGGPANAKKQGISYGTAFQRFVDPVYTGRSNIFVVNNITTPVYTQGGKEQSPSRGTYCKKMGLLEMDESKEIFNITSLGNAILNKDLTTKEYALILLSKMGVFKDGVYIDNVFCVLSSYFHSNPVISLSLLEKYIKNRYNVSEIEKTRLDIIINAISLTGLITKVKDELFTVSNTEYALVFNEFLANSQKLRPAIIDNASNYSNYIGSIDYGVFDILTKDNIEIFNKYYPNLSKYMNNNSSANQVFDTTLQQIFYGSPGTGKSHNVKKLTGELSNDGEDRDLPNVFRTTFHPDTDYASFVGCYKPSMRKTGKKHQVDGKDVDDEEIIYEFVPQTFADAYVYAYNNPAEPTYLVIEEINRGNCAQIFGDLFQLLDRKNGISEYKIKPDKDLAKFLKEGKEENGKEVLINKDGIRDGKICLPANLNILATMNTSDQSLFPIDSAFKRRWEWKYTPIAQGKDKSGNLMKWQIEGQGDNSWWTFIQGINEVIDVTTHSEDKKLGFFFCKANGTTIEKETFVNKVVFYLWNDVFKVYGFKSEIFDKKGKGDKTEKITFKSFYNDDGSVNEETMSVFVKNVMAKAPKENSNDVTNENEEITEESKTEA